MDQASTTGRTSAISMGLAGSVSSSLKSAGVGSLPSKMSQKERKRLQLLQQGGKSESPGDVPVSSSLAPAPSSPWHTAGSKPNPATRSSSLTVTPVQSGTSTPRAPHLTMRQTVANPGPSVSKEKPSTTATTPQLRPSSSKSASTPKKGTKAADPTTDSPGFAISDRPVPITSVRHVPARELSMSLDQHSLIDILSEQAIAKQEIRDFGAKRSLQEIQQEQEFQEWWDKERRRVEEEEEAARKGKENKSTKSGGARRRGKAKEGKEGQKEGRKIELRGKRKGKAEVGGGGSGSGSGQPGAV